MPLTKGEAIVLVNRIAAVCAKLGLSGKDLGEAAHYLAAVLAWGRGLRKDQPKAMPSKVKELLLQKVGGCDAAVTEAIEKLSAARQE